MTTETKYDTSRIKSLHLQQRSNRASTHFFASSFAHWYTATDLGELIRYMDRQKIDNVRPPYTVWFVPKAQGADYQIEDYAPQVPGARVVAVVHSASQLKEAAKTK